MLALTIALSLAAAGQAAPVSSAPAVSVPAKQGPTPAETVLDVTDPRVLTAAVQSAGFQAELKTGNDGLSYISSAANGQTFTLELYDCRDGKCSSFQFASWWKADPMFTPAMTNEWNLKKRFLRVSVNSSGQLIQSLDVNAVGGMTLTQLKGWFTVYQLMDGELARFIRDKRAASTTGATKPSAP